MKTLYRWLILTSLTLSFSACSPPMSQSPIGIIDLERISMEIGHTAIAQETLSELSTDLQKELNDSQNKRQDDMQKAQDKIGEKPTEEQLTEMRKIATKMQTEMMQKQANATQTLQNKKTEILTAFRNKVRAVADSIAQQRGMHIVLLRNPAILLGNDKSVDITDAVLVAMKKTGGDSLQTKKDNNSQ